MGAAGRRSPSSAGCCARAACAASTCRRGAASASSSTRRSGSASAPAEEMDDHKTLLRPPRPVADAGRGRASARSDIRCFTPQVRPQHVRRLPRRHRRHRDELTLHRDLPRRDRGRSSTRSTPTSDRGRRRRPRRGPRARRAAVHPRRRRLGRARRATRSTTSASSAASRPTRRPTTSPSSPPAPTTRAGTPRSRRGCEGSRLGADDALLVFSVGGGDAERRTSRPTSSRAARAGRRSAAPRSSASSAATAATPPQLADACVVIPPLFPDRITPHTEGLCAVVWHLLVSHPALQRDRRPSGSRVAVTGAGDASAFVDRRRRRLHRQPLHRPPAGRPRRPSAVTALRQLLLRPATGTYAAHRRRPAAAPSSRGDVERPARRCAGAMAGHDTVIHLASNPDIARGGDRTRRSTSTRAPLLTHHVVEAMRAHAASRRSLYASGSGVYGDLGELEAAGGPRPAGAGRRPTARASWPARR